MQESNPRLFLNHGGPCVNQMNNDIIVNQMKNDIIVDQMKNDFFVDQTKNDILVHQMQNSVADQNIFHDECIEDFLKV